MTRRVNKGPPAPPPRRGAHEDDGVGREPLTASLGSLGEVPFRELIDGAPDAVVVTDAQGRILLVNRQSEALFGYDREELVHQPVEVLVPSDLRTVHPAHRSGYAADPRTRPMGANLDLRARRKDGSEVAVDIALSSFVTDAGALIVTASVRDVTERTELERELRRSREEAVAANLAKSEFLSRMSHELRTPLNAVLGFAQLLELGELTAEQQEAVGQITRAGRHLLDLINEVLDISRIESGQLTLSREPVPLRQVIQETVPLVRPLAAARRITLAHPDLAHCGHYVMADHQRLKQVLLNLLSNAVKYNRDGGRVDLEWVPEWVPVGAAVDDGVPGQVRVHVRDTGRGIAEEDLPRLFTPFDRLGAEHLDVDGSGVGLAISQKLVDAMGGTLEVDSLVGRGSTFSVILESAEESVPEDVMLAQPTGEPHTERVVLYVEDNLSNLRLMERVVALRPAWQLVHALHGSLAVDLAHSRQADLVLLDLHLPDMPGLEVLERLRADRGTSDIPVWVVSADATRSQRQRLLGAGADGYLTKPIDVAEVIGVLDRVDAEAEQAEAEQAEAERAGTERAEVGGDDAGGGPG